MKALQALIILLSLALISGIIAGIFLWSFFPPNNTSTYSFPDSFKIGAATASYQIEGGWNIDGKSPNIWDNLVHTQPDLIADKSNADVGTDSYHLYKEDVKALKAAGVSTEQCQIL